MKPYIICHMVSSVNGGILPDRWKPAFSDSGAYERLHEEIGGDAWLVGRVTGQEFAQRDTPYPTDAAQVIERTPWFAQKEAESWAIVLDAEGKIAWGRSDIGGDALLVVLTEAVSDAHLAGLRADGVSYIFAGATKLDLGAALETLNSELGISRLLLEGGGVANGALLQSGLIDELSLVIAPSVELGTDGPSILSLPEGLGGLDNLKLELTDCQTLDAGLVWLRYRLSWGE